MATLSQLRDRVDTWLADKWPTVVARQQNFFSNKGRYWQGLKTHTLDPAHTNGSDGDAVPDRLNANPTDQFENWSNVFPEWDGLPIPCALQIDTYGTPQRNPDGTVTTLQGWVATIWVRFNGVLYSRSQNVGPLSDRRQAWHVVEET